MRQQIHGEVVYAGADMKDTKFSHSGFDDLTVEFGFEGVPESSDVAAA
jgi:hypothetical protein